MDELAIVIDGDGSVRFIYDDALVGLFGEEARWQIRRASHVEPCARGGWTADMTPIGGPVLGPFPLRSAALAAERDWLTQHGW